MLVVIPVCKSDLWDGGFLDGAADEPDGQPLYCKAGLWNWQLIQCALGIMIYRAGCSGRREKMRSASLVQEFCRMKAIYQGKYPKHGRKTCHGAEVK